MGSIAISHLFHHTWTPQNESRLSGDPHLSSQNQTFPPAVDGRTCTNMEYTPARHLQDHTTPCAVKFTVGCLQGRTPEFCLAAIKRRGGRFFFAGSAVHSQRQGGRVSHSTCEKKRRRTQHWQSGQGSNPQRQQGVWTAKHEPQILNQQELRRPSANPRRLLGYPTYPHT